MASGKSFPSQVLFTKEERVRLYFLLTDIIPPPIRQWGAADLGGDGMVALHELLRRSLGRMVIGGGPGVADALRDFVTDEPEDELLTMLELLPVAYEQEIWKLHSRRLSSPELTSVCLKINQFLERIGSRARFDKRGKFTRDGLADETPIALKALPGKEKLHSDVSYFSQEVLAVIYFDLDNFKNVNDAHGHIAGDKCLTIVAAAAGGAIVSKGRLYRYGGDEFVVVLRNFSTAEASATAERLRAAIQQAKPVEEIEVTTSIGVATTEMANIDRTKLIQAADAAMYKSKKGSKNCVTLWTKDIGYLPHKDDKM